MPPQYSFKDCRKIILHAFRCLKIIVVYCLTVTLKSCSNIYDVITGIILKCPYVMHGSEVDLLHMKPMEKLI
jgi:hypothetical protein